MSDYVKIVISKCRKENGFPYIDENGNPTTNGVPIAEPIIGSEIYNSNIKNWVGRSTSAQDFQYVGDWANNDDCLKITSVDDLSDDELTTAEIPVRYGEVDDGDSLEHYTYLHESDLPSGIDITDTLQRPLTLSAGLHDTISFKQISNSDQYEISVSDGQILPPENYGETITASVTVGAPVDMKTKLKEVATDRVGTEFVQWEGNYNDAPTVAVDDDRFNVWIADGSLETGKTLLTLGSLKIGISNKELIPDIIGNTDSDLLRPSITITVSQKILRLGDAEGRVIEGPFLKNTSYNPTFGTGTNIGGADAWTKDGCECGTANDINMKVSYYSVAGCNDVALETTLGRSYIYEENSYKTEYVSSAFLSEKLGDEDISGDKTIVPTVGTTKELYSLEQCEKLEFEFISFDEIQEQPFTSWPAEQYDSLFENTSSFPDMTDTAIDGEHKYCCSTRNRCEDVAALRGESTGPTYECTQVWSRVQSGADLSDGEEWNSCGEDGQDSCDLKVAEYVDCEGNSTYFHYSTDVTPSIMESDEYINYYDTCGRFESFPDPETIESSTVSYAKNSNEFGTFCFCESTESSGESGSGASSGVPSGASSGASSEPPTPTPEVSSGSSGVPSGASGGASSGLSCPPDTDEYTYEQVCSNTLDESGIQSSNCECEKRPRTASSTSDPHITTFFGERYTL